MLTEFIISLKTFLTTFVFHLFWNCILATHDATVCYVHFGTLSAPQMIHHQKSLMKRWILLRFVTLAAVPILLWCAIWYCLKDKVFSDVKLWHCVSSRRFWSSYDRKKGQKLTHRHSFISQNYLHFGSTRVRSLNLSWLSAMEDETTMLLRNCGQISPSDALPQLRKRFLLHSCQSLKFVTWVPTL